MQSSSTNTNDRSVGVVIPTYNGLELIKKCLDSLRDFPGPVWVIDDCGTDNTAEIIRNCYPHVNLIRNDKNRGFSSTANRGIRACETDLVVLLNNDTEVTPDFPEQLCELFDDDNLFAVSPKIILPKLQNLDEGAKTGIWYHGIFYTDQESGVTHITPILYATGCAAVFRRSMLNQLGGFDEAYSPFYWEDADLGYRAWKRGWKTVYQPACTVYHTHSASISKLPNSRTHRIQIRNAMWFIWRNIDDASLAINHFLFFPFILLRKVLTGKYDFAVGMLMAIPGLGRCIKARNKDRVHRVLTDAQIMEASRIID